MVDPFNGVPYSFGALRQTFGPLYVRCDVCRRYARLHIGGLRDVDYRTRTFSCSVCGGPGALAITDPSTETGMTDYRLDQREAPERHPKAAHRAGNLSRPTVSHSGGELPGRNLKGMERRSTKVAGAAFVRRGWREGH